MFHKVNNVFPLPDYKLSIQFAEGVTKIYDVTQCFAKWRPFAALQNNFEKFCEVVVDDGGYGIVWDDTIDLSCNELWENGE